MDGCPEGVPRTRSGGVLSTVSHTKHRFELPEVSTATKSYAPSTGPTGTVTAYATFPNGGADREGGSGSDGGGNAGRSRNERSRRDGVDHAVFVRSYGRGGNVARFQCLAAAMGVVTTGAVMSMAVAANVNGTPATAAGQSEIRRSGRYENGAGVSRISSKRARILR